MYVGTLRARLIVRHARSLKDKRQVVRSILDRLRHEFNVAAAEVDALDEWQSIVLGFAMVGPDNLLLRQTLERIANALRAHPVAEFVDCELDVEGR
jgi:uncharacterized protein YlxP (DUF503 family)